MARPTRRRWRCFVVSSQQQRRAQGRCANEEEEEDDEDAQQQPGATMVLSSTEEIVYRFLGFAQATRPRTCSPFHQVRAYVRSSCSSSFLLSPTSPPLTFLIDCSSSPSLLLPSYFKQRKNKKNSPLLACLSAANKNTGYSNLLSFSISFLFSSYFFRLGFRLHQPCRCSSSCSSLKKEKKGKSSCLLACCQQEDPVTPTYSPFHQARVIFVHANFVSIYLLDAPPPPPLSSEKRKGLACLLPIRKKERK